MKKTVKDILQMKGTGKKITCLTAYDYPTAQLLDEAGIDIVLVGDSLGMVLLGYETTCCVRMAEMLHHTKAVSRAVKTALVVGDLPFGSYEDRFERAYRNARQLMQKGGAQAVKLEGGVSMAKIIKELTGKNIPVMGHVGLTPQSVERLGGYKVQGRTPKEARRILDDARALEDAGVFSIVLECIPAPVAQHITASVSVPTLGIGAGPDCDGQVLVIHDVLGLLDGPDPRFVRRYANLRMTARQAIRQFRDDVREGAYPSAEESYGAGASTSRAPTRARQNS